MPRIVSLLPLGAGPDFSGSGGRSVVTGAMSSHPRPLTGLTVLVYAACAQGSFVGWFLRPVNCRLPSFLKREILGIRKW